MDTTTRRRTLILRYMGRRGMTAPPNAGVVGANVRRLRTDRRMTQHGLADVSGLSRSTIAAVELGKYKGMTAATLEMLARALGTTRDDLSSPRPDEGPSAEYVDALRTSSWASAIQPTDEELEWASRLPDFMWVGMRPTPETIARLIQLRRDRARDGG